MPARQKAHKGRPYDAPQEATNLSRKKGRIVGMRPLG